MLCSYNLSTKDAEADVSIVQGPSCLMRSRFKIIIINNNNNNNTEHAVSLLGGLGRRIMCNKTPISRGKRVVLFRAVFLIPLLFSYCCVCRAFELVGQCGLHLSEAASFSNYWRWELPPACSLSW